MPSPGPTSQTLNVDNPPRNEGNAQAENATAPITDNTSAADVPSVHWPADFILEANKFKIDLFAPFRAPGENPDVELNLNAKVPTSNSPDVSSTASNINRRKAQARHAQEAFRLRKRKEELASMLNGTVVLPEGVGPDWARNREEELRHYINKSKRRLAKSFKELEDSELEKTREDATSRGQVNHLGSHE